MMEFKAIEETGEGFGMIKRFSRTLESGHMWVCVPYLPLQLALECPGFAPLPSAL